MTQVIKDSAAAAAMLSGIFTFEALNCCVRNLTTLRSACSEEAHDT